MKTLVHLRPVCSDGIKIIGILRNTFLKMGRIGETKVKIIHGHHM